MTRFIDYFFMCGLAENKQPKFYKLHEEDTVSVIQNKGLESSILCHFPQQVADNPWNSAELWKFCTPCGLSVFIGETPPIIAPHFHSFLITREDGSKSYGHVLVFFERCVNSNQIISLTDAMQLPNLKPNENIYIEKCVGFITQLALINTCEKVLKTLFKLFMKDLLQPNNYSLSIESYIYNLLYEVPSLTPGTSFKLSWIGHDEPAVIQQPSLQELPLLDVYMMQVMGLVGGPKNLLSLLTSCLLEHQILLVSEDSHRLSLVGEGIMALLFPFQWQHTQIFILPYEIAVRFFDAPVPYVIGVLVLPGQKELVRKALEVDQCYVDLDDAIIETPEEQPDFPNQKEIVSKIESYYKHYSKEMKVLARNSMKLKQPNFSCSNTVNTENPLQINDATNRVAVKDGVVSSPDDIEGFQNEESINSKHGAKLQVSERILCELKFNIRLRETIVNVFTSIFQSYDKFVIMPCLDEHGLWTFSTETQDNFDKTSFISDQPLARLSFLFSFLDTQMFASFIDNYVIHHQQAGAEAKDPNLRVFDKRIENLRGSADPHPPSTPDAHTVQPLFRSFSVSSNHFSSAYLDNRIKESELSLEKRLCKIDVSTGFPKPIQSDIVVEISPGTFPTIQAKLLDPELFEKTKKHQLSRRAHSNRTAFKRGPSIKDSKWKKVQEARHSILRQPSVSEYSPELIAQYNWKYVRKLLKDVKLKTKKLLVGKMGREAVELGHGELSDSLFNLEERTWIGSFCDLLEKVWSHGLLINFKKSKSALWSHLIHYQADEEESIRKKSMLPHFSESSPSLFKKEEEVSSGSFDPTSSYNSLPRSFPRKLKESHRSSSDLRPRSPENSSSRTSSSSSSLSSSASSSTVNTIPHLTLNLLSSIRIIQSMKEIQTEVGRSRAWIRLMLEEKQLNSCLKKLLSNELLLDRMYKKYSLLQCEEQREQFLYHLLTLKAADFTCFTTSFKQSTFEYKVWIVPGRNLGKQSQTSANVSMLLCGELEKTKKIELRRNCLEFSFEYRNLGALSTLIIGHDNAGFFPKWFLDYVIVQNQVTGQTHCFPCRRWLGRNVDDNSIERLLVAQVVPRDKNIVNVATRLCEEKIKSNQPHTNDSLQERVGHAVNCLIKFYYKPDSEHQLDVPGGFFVTPPAAFTKLLCDLTTALECVFTHGLKTTGFFKRRRLYALDIFASCLEYLCSSIHPPLSSHDSLSDDEYEPTHVAAGGDWFLGNRSMSQARRSIDVIRTNRYEFNSMDNNGSCVGKERAAFARMCQLYQQITDRPSGLGKDDLFQLLILIGIHERIISYWLPKISVVARKANNLYENHAFLRDEAAVGFMSQVLTLLVENEVPLDYSLLRGFNDLTQF